MGLGKTIQAIALTWILLKQSPFLQSTNVIKKCLVLCPASLLSNWKKEFQKWLGNDRVRVFLLDQNNTLKHFMIGKHYQILITSYEKFRSCYEELNTSNTIDLIICDEGHRLKNSKIQLTQALKQFKCLKRIILSGTPIQNDLNEFYTLVDLVNPGE